MIENSFELAGKELPWPIVSAPGLTNHPDISTVAHNIDNIAETGISVVTGGSTTLGDARGGSAYVKTVDGWEYKGGDEHVDLTLGAGYNAKSLPNPGSDATLAYMDDLVEMTKSRGVELAWSLSPCTSNPIEELTEFLEISRRILAKGVLYVEINLSCPNVPDKPLFYKDEAGVASFYEMLDRAEPLVNVYGHPGIYPKYGPLTVDEFNRAAYLHKQPVRNIGGRVTSNTLANQIPKIGDEDAIKVNGGKAGMSGPALRYLGRLQAKMWSTLQQGSGLELITALGIDSGREIKDRIDGTDDMKANAAQLGSVIYWPQLKDFDTQKEVVRKIKDEFIQANQAV